MASRAGVSVATVSRILSGAYTAPPATHDRVMDAVRELDYVVNANARSLSTASGMVAMVVNDITSPFFMNVASGVEEQAVADGRVCLVCSTQGVPERELSVINLMRQRGAEAIILVGGMAETEEHLAQLAAAAEGMDRAGARMVLCARPWKGAKAPVDVVECDMEAGAFAATSHLISAGHTRVAHLAGPHEFSVAGQRLEGYERALRAHGIKPDPALVAESDMTRESGYEAACRLLTGTDATAIFCASDMSAAGAIAAARDLGRSVPGDVSVVGFDDIPLAEDLYPRLTTVHVPQQELGRSATRLALHRRPTDPPSRRVVLGSHVVVRESVAPPARLNTVGKADS
ncbi:MULTISPECIES: LacI family DNA-binding transcriptional regulator [unclassified Streptomyces]|uniref:LacI family DNA-binding transcriptional regulator n=1 Tax=unclassified Streptomyces TaxID=2593676 RepID=UPI002253FBFB|nr:MULTISPECIES: LacI family DNA-binding transcriptional regulator [unclassified Streptomyces]WTB37233.1 LacI family transcriptional regulator [Streptomyces sp. NBC_00827]WUC15092.1 LacI family transcriptional regulator [Streptomyces sp. NBC_00564]WUC48458.1 LacI family transcriptional regulator [Streptomyces sp. NBC_00554]MCX4978655.1 LacI family transcriptional regulator [Streptomyces sp. NBC_00620]WRZ18717.1 LacI family transcriptional regulator [Streptomyces sp. NBC_00243]